MAKFSIIVPVYNTSSYLPKCFDSILSQSMDDYEVIIINDGSTDNSQKIINKYVKRYKDKFIGYETENKGLSEARNYGVKKAKGDYILFVDSDDYIEKNLIKRLSASLKNDPDLIRYQIKTVKSNYKIKERLHEEEFTGLNGPVAFSKIVKYRIVESACCYAIKRKFYNKNKFKFAKDRYHEDFGLIPLVIMKANIVNSIDYIGYNYMEREDSIMTNNSYDKVKKKVYDFLFGFDYQLEIISNDNSIKEEDKKEFKSFIANSVIIKARELKKEDLKEYKTELKSRDVYNLILSDTFKRNLKKILIKCNLELYLRIYC